MEVKPVSHYSTYLKFRPCRLITVQIVYEIRVKDSSSVIQNASQTFEATGKPQDQAMRISIILKRNVKKNFIFFGKI